MKKSILLQFSLTLALTLLLGLSKISAQRFQVAAGGGPAALYVVENASTNVNYYNGLAFQTDFTFLDSNKLPNYGFSLYSYGADSWLELELIDREIFRGLVSNTGFTASKYFSKQLTKKFSGNLQIGTGLNLETFWSGTTRMMLNINFGAEVKYQLGKKWFIQAKGLAVAQDVPNIIRFYALDDYQEAGEDLQLLMLVGLAVNIGK
ncbi:MAG: hypothetical protein RJQ00_08985 [Vicingaceae bacterium]